MLTVVYDTCVLYPAPLRDLLVRLALAGLVRARWSDDILDEMVRSILRERTDLSADKLARTRKLMCEAVPDCLVTGYRRLIPSLHLPDADDRHVLAAAIRAGAQVIVTSNLRHFPAKDLVKYAISAESPDSFVLRLLEQSVDDIVGVVRDQAASLRAPPVSVAELLETLDAIGLNRSVFALKARLRLESRRRGGARTGCGPCARPALV